MIRTAAPIWIFLSYNTTLRETTDCIIHFNYLYISDLNIDFNMPTNKEELALRWAMKSEEEKNLIRKKNAQKVKLHRAGKVSKKRSEMKPEELSKLRETDKRKKRMKRMKMTDEQRDTVKAKDRERKAKDREKKFNDKEKKAKEIKITNEDNSMKAKEAKTDFNKWEQKKMKQLLDNCKTQQKLETERTEDEKEDIEVEKVRIMREKRSQMKITAKKLARIHAKNGMREHRTFGYIKEYKQRKRRDSFNPESWEKEPHAISEYFQMVKESETTLERKEKMKRMNQIRVERHREKIKKMLQAPVIVENYGEKGEYELLREKNIQEFERLKEESGLFT